MSPEKPIESPHFAVHRYIVDGNVLISSEDLAQRLRSFTGENLSFADVQKALKALEEMYRERGYTGIHVIIPEQSLDTGEVHVTVIEGRLGKVTISGNQHHTEANIRAAFPALKEGEMPVTARISDNLQLSNENPSKYIDLLLNTGADKGTVDADIRVRDAFPQRFSATFDNTGTPDTGPYRLALSYQHNNVWGLDHGLSLSYSTSPYERHGVRIGVYSLGYRVPFYALNSALDLLYAHSSADIPSSSQSLAGALGINGKGDLWSMRWNWLLPRQGEYASRFIFAQDVRNMKSACETPDGSLLTGVAGCENYQTLPFSLSYVGRLDQLSRNVSFNLGVTRNMSGSDASSYRFASGDRDAQRNFVIGKAGFALSQPLPFDLLWRANGQAQFSRDRLVFSEQIGLAGSSSVRGFSERAVAADRGFFVQNELYAPDLAPLLNTSGSFRLLGFVDAAHGATPDLPATNTPINIASAGFGVRYNYGRDIDWRLDVARILKSYAVTHGGALIDEKWRVHFNVTVSY